MKKDMLLKILIGLGIITLGVLVAIFGPAQVLNLYFGIACCAVGGAYVIYGVFLLSKKMSVPAVAFIAGAALVSIGIGFLIEKISTQVLIDLIIFAILGAGGGLVLYGIYLLGKKINFSSVAVLTFGVATLTFAILYLAVPKFRDIFWIVIGILIAIYGLYSIVILFVKKRGNKVVSEQ